MLFCIFQARDPQQEAKEELENLKKQHDLLKRMLQQQEQLKALQGRQAALLALQHKAEQAVAVVDDSGMKAPLIVVLTCWLNDWSWNCRIHVKSFLVILFEVLLQGYNFFFQF